MNDCHPYQLIANICVKHAGCCSPGEHLSGSQPQDINKGSAARTRPRSSRGTDGAAQSSGSKTDPAKRQKASRDLRTLPNTESMEIPFNYKRTRGEEPVSRRTRSHTVTRTNEDAKRARIEDEPMELSSIKHSY